MAVYMNNFTLDVPIQRLGDGNYMFGSRKIYAKIMNDKLVVRVGGGYMLIDEFLNTYGHQEIDKINMLAARNAAAGGNFTGDRGSPQGRQSPKSAAMNKARMSPNNRGSPINAFK